MEKAKEKCYTHSKRKENISIAKNMLKENIEPTLIEKMTGLSTKELENLK